MFFIKQRILFIFISILLLLFLTLIQFSKQILDLNYTNLLLSCLTFCIILAICYLIAHPYFFHNRALTIVTNIYLITNAIFVLFPIVYAIFAGSPDDIGTGATENEWAIGVWMQSAYIFCWFVGFISLGKASIFKQFISKIRFKCGNKNKEFFLIILLLLVSLGVQFYFISQRYFFYGAYDEKLVLGEDVSFATFWGSWLEFLMPTAVFLSFGRGICRRNGIYKFGRMIGFLSFLIITLISIIQIAQRFLLIFPFVLIASLTYFQDRKAELKRIAIGLIIGGLLILLFGHNLSVYRQIFWKPEGKQGNFLFYFTLLKENISHIDLNKNLYSIATRLDLAQNNGLIYSYANNTGFAYLRPYYGVLCAWIPRILWSGKPYPGSFDGTYATSPEYLLGYIRTGIWGGYHSATRPAAGVMYWHFGWLGVLLGGAIIGMLWRILIEASTKDNSQLGIIAFLMIISQIIIPGDNLDKVLLFASRSFILLLILNRLSNLLPDKLFL